MFMLSDGFRSVQVRHDAARLTQALPASKRYVTVCPNALAARLNAAGAQATVFAECMTMYRGGHRAPNPWVAGLNVDFPGLGDRGEGTERYSLSARILMRHDGRGGVRLEPGVMRVACANQFHAPARYSFSHVERAILNFLENPYPFVEQTALYGEELVHKLDILRRAGHDGHPLLNAICIAKPRVGAEVMRAAQSYEPTSWGVLQGLTGTHKKTPERLAAICLTAGWEDLREGRVPAALEAVLS